MTTFLDTNILIHIINPLEKLHTWSLEQLQVCKVNGPVIISDVVYSEFSIGMESIAAVDEVIYELQLERTRASDAALFRAGRAFKQYRLFGGPKTNVLPDFFIGAIAEIAGAPLLTANQKDYVNYFPKLKVISP